MVWRKLSLVSIFIVRSAKGKPFRLSAAAAEYVHIVEWCSSF